jgi:hypothetical protein
MALKSYFTRGTEPELPEVRRWREKGLKPIGCKLLRERDGLAFRPAQLAIRFDGSPRPAVMLWDGGINDWLVAHRVRAENEADRFGFMLREQFGPIQQRYGDGFFNSVLLHDLRADAELVAHADVREALDGIQAPRPMRGAAARDCGDMIQSVLTSCGTALVARLKYGHDEAEETFCAALVYFLDERFSITNSRILGWSFEGRAQSPVVQCLTRQLVRPRIYFDVELPGPPSHRVEHRQRRAAPLPPLRPAIGRASKETRAGARTYAGGPWRSKS